MAHLGKKGGAKGGKSTSKKKREAVKKNLEKAREKRWPVTEGALKCSECNGETTAQNPMMDTGLCENCQQEAEDNEEGDCEHCPQHCP